MRASPPFRVRPDRAHCQPQSLAKSPHFADLSGAAVPCRHVDRYAVTHDVFGPSRAIGVHARLFARASTGRATWHRPPRRARSSSMSPSSHLQRRTIHEDITADVSTEPDHRPRHCHSFTESQSRSCIPSPWPQLGGEPRRHRISAEYLPPMKNSTHPRRRAYVHLVAPPPAPSIPVPVGVGVEPGGAAPKGPGPEQTKPGGGRNGGQDRPGGREGPGIYQQNARVWCDPRWDGRDLGEWKRSAKSDRRIDGERCRRGWR
jgi:hypothetical protein